MQKHAGEFGENFLSRLIESSESNIDVDRSLELDDISCLVMAFPDNHEYLVAACSLSATSRLF